jgi:two-component system, OmpR family, response regulator ResD
VLTSGGPALSRRPLLAIIEAMPTSHTRGEILVVDDEPTIGEVVSRYLERAGYTTRVAGDGDRALALHSERAADLVVLDLMLPGVDGLEVLRRIRRDRSRRPAIILLTAKGEESDRIVGLRLGADDYVVKPFSPAELVARVDAVLRRVDPEPEHEPPLEFDGLRIEPVTHRVAGDDAEVHLTPTEFRLLLTLARRQDGLVGHADLLRAVWGPTYCDETQLLRVTMRNLRAKLATATPGRTFIATEYGLGYRFLPER